jgi:hypothetical protein
MSRYDFSRGGHAHSHLREWFLSYLDGETNPADERRRPSLWKLTGVLWNCDDTLPRQFTGDLDSWCQTPWCPLCEGARPGTYAHLARLVRAHLRAGLAIEPVTFHTRG